MYQILVAVCLDRHCWTGGQRVNPVSLPTEQQRHPCHFGLPAGQRKPLDQTQNTDKTYDQVHTKHTHMH